MFIAVIILFIVIMLKIDFLGNHLKTQEKKTMAAINGLMDSVSALQAEDQVVIAAVLALTQKVADLQDAINNAGDNVDPQIVAASDAIKAEIAKLHDAVTPAPTP